MPRLPDSIRLYAERYEVCVGEHRLALTVREFRLLAALMRAPNVVLSPQQLMEMATGAACGEPEAKDCANVLLERIRSKLEACGVDRILNVRGVGYMLNAELARGRRAGAS